MSHVYTMTPEERAEARAQIEEAFAAALYNFDQYGSAVFVISSEPAPATGEAQEPCNECGKVHPQNANRMSLINSSEFDRVAATISLIEATVEDMSAPAALKYAATLDRALRDSIAKSFIQGILGIDGEELNRRKDIAKAAHAAPYGDKETPSSTH